MNLLRYFSWWCMKVLFHLQGRAHYFYIKNGSSKLVYPLFATGAELTKTGTWQLAHSDFKEMGLTLNIPKNQR